MRLSHRLARVFLGSACGPADHLRNEVLDSRRRHTMVCFVHQGVGIQSRVYHDPVDEVGYYSSDAVHAAKSVVERRLFGWLHEGISFLVTNVPERRSER